MSRGAELEPQRVARARQDEMEFFRKMNAYTRCPRARIEVGNRKAHQRQVDRHEQG